MKEVIDEKASGIVCSIRGGVESKVTIARAVTLAQETCLPLHFLYVINSDLIATAGRGDQDALVENVRQMGCSVLGAARAWARFQGVESQGVVRHGVVEAEIIDFCRDIEATYLVLGRSHYGDKESIHSPDQFVQLVERKGIQLEAVVVFH